MGIVRMVIEQLELPHDPNSSLAQQLITVSHRGLSDIA